MVKSRRGQGHMTYFFKFWDPLRNFWTGKARHFVFTLVDRDRRVLHSGLWMTPKGRGQGHVTYFFKFWDPLHNFWTEKGRHFFFLW